MRRRDDPAAAADHRAGARSDAAPASGDTSPTTRSRATGRRPIWSIPTAWPTRRAACTCWPTCRSTARSARSPSSGSRTSRCSKSASRRSRNCRTTAFPHSLGVHSGPPERVEIEFRAGGRRLRARARVASVAAASRRRAGRPCAMTLDVCLDRALQSWILSFGPFARVRRAGRARARDRGTIRRSESEVRVMTDQISARKRRSR